MSPSIFDIIWSLICLTISLNGNQLLLCFSFKRNWYRLTKDPELERLRCLNGLKAITIFLVIIEHSPLTFILALDNPHGFEKMFDILFYRILLDGTIMVQTFFILTGCLLAYQLQEISDKERLNWKIIPKSILQRYLRLTPTYAVVLLFTMTWLRFSGSGPIWQKTISPEVHSCRHYGWLNLVYINNYYHNTQCMSHTWYLAADMQLFVVGVIVMVLACSDLARNVTTSMLFALGLILPAYHTYAQNLHAQIIFSPEVARGRFIKDPTFNYGYKPGHVNLICFVIGISVGRLIYRLQKENFNISPYRKYRCLYWAICPALIGMILLNRVFYMDGVSPSLILKAIYSSFSRLAIGVLIFFLILGMVFKLENVYRPLLEWKGWTAPSRVSYSAYLLHVALIEVTTGSRTTLFHASFIETINLCIGISFSAYILAFLLWLTVEAPLRALVKAMLSAR